MGLLRPSVLAHMRQLPALLPPACASVGTDVKFAGSFSGHSTEHTMKAAGPGEKRHYQEDSNFESRCQVLMDKQSSVKSDG